MCGQIFRFAIAIDLVERDVTVDLKGALTPVVKSNYAAITEPQQAGILMRAIFDYNESPEAMRDDAAKADQKGLRTKAGSGQGVARPAIPCRCVSRQSRRRGDSLG